MISEGFEGVICVKDSRFFLGLIGGIEKKLEGVHTISVLQMPDNRQVQRNATPNQSANNIEGSTGFLYTLLGVQRDLIMGFVKYV